MCRYFQKSIIRHDCIARAAINRGGWEVGGDGLQQAMCGNKNYLWNQNAWVLMQSVQAGRAPDPPAKERERLQETHTHRAEASLRGTPHPIVSPSDCLCSLRTRPTTRWKVVQPWPDQPDRRRCLWATCSLQLRATSIQKFYSFTIKRLNE